MPFQNTLHMRSTLRYVSFVMIVEVIIYLFMKNEKQALIKRFL